MATVTIPTKLIDNQAVFAAFIEAFHEGKFFPGYWVNHLPKSELGNVKLFTDGNLVMAQSTVIYGTYEEAFDAHNKIQDYITSNRGEILFKVGRERNLVYYTYNFMKI